MGFSLSSPVMEADGLSVIYYTVFVTGPMAIWSALRSGHLKDLWSEGRHPEFTFWATLLGVGVVFYLWIASVVIRSFLD